MKYNISEAQLAEAVVTYLEGWQWEVYQEVSHNGGARCDIIATRGKIQWAIECKLSLGFPVLEQAYNWKPWCHYVSVAVPYSRGNFSERICDQLNIGILHVNPIYILNPSRCFPTVSERKAPKLFRQALGLKLVEEQKHWAKAGSQSGCGYYTPFKKTVMNMINIVSMEAGIEYVDLIKKSEHHYGNDTTARNCLRKFIGTSVIPELRLELIDKKMCVFLKDS
jgi:hypothetical protein